jgi:hypothetical protein
MQKYRTLAAAHHVRFLDYSDSAPAGNQSLFYNSQHLNRRGAEVFTTLLASDLSDISRNEN